MLRLFTYWMSPFWNPSEALCCSARKCSASSASAWASVIGGISVVRGCARKPVKYRRVYWISTRSGVVAVAGWWYSSGRSVYGLSGLPNLHRPILPHTISFHFLPRLAASRAVVEIHPGESPAGPRFACDAACALGTSHSPDGTGCPAGLNA